MGEIPPKQLLNHNWAILGLDALQDLSTNRRLMPVGAPDDNVETFDRVAFIVNGDLAANQPNVTDVMLRARVGATREMDIDGLVDVQARLDVSSDAFGRMLGVGGRQLAAAIAGAGHKTGTDSGCFPIEAQRLDARLGCPDLRFGNAGDDEVLPDGKSDIAITQIPGDGRQFAHLGRQHLAHGEHDADVVQPRLLLRMYADVHL